LTSSHADFGLLSPVYAGTAVEQATGDSSVLQAMLRAEAALVRALASTGLVDQGIADAIVPACTPAGFDLAELAGRSVAGGNPVIPMVETLRSRVSAASPVAARWVHHGATSQDIVDTAMMLITAEALGFAAADLRVSAERVAGLMTLHRDTPLVGRTLTQQAMPITLGVKLAGWLIALTDAIIAIENRARALPAQLGGPVGAGAAYGDRAVDVLDAFADDLGLVAPVLPWHTRRAPVVEVAGAVQLGTVALAKVSADVLVMSRTEIGELRDRGGGPSSAMAHKQNPARAIQIAAAAREIPALVSILVASAAAEDERPAGAWHAEWQPWRQSLRLLGGAAARCADLLDDLEIDTGAMDRNVGMLADRLGLAPAGTAAGLWVDRASAVYEELRRG
jgi:3-carboxy-cis,cis-muconate cycloisomerase